MMHGVCIAGPPAVAVYSLHMFTAYTCSINGVLCCLPCGVTRTLSVPLCTSGLCTCRQASPLSCHTQPVRVGSHLAACRSRCLLTEAAAAVAPMVSRACWSCCRQGLKSSLLLCRNTRISTSLRAAPQLASMPDCPSPGWGIVNTPCGQPASRSQHQASAQHSTAQRTAPDAPSRR